MKSIRFAFASLGLLALGACSRQVDAGEPLPYVIVTPPAWANALGVEAVGWSESRVRDTFGRSVKVAGAGTDLGRGLTARRSHYHLSVTDADGVLCEWSAERALESCRRANPAYADYMMAKRNIRF